MVSPISLYAAAAVLLLLAAVIGRRGRTRLGDALADGRAALAGTLSVFAVRGPRGGWTAIDVSLVRRPASAGRRNGAPDEAQIGRQMMSVGGGGNELHSRPGLPWWVHLAALLVICSAAGIRFYPLVASESARTDERVYLEAFRAVSAGESPYAAAGSGLDFYYPPPFAVLGSAALAISDSRSVVIALRSANLLGLACCLWCSFLFVPLAWRWCLAGAVLYCLLGPEALHHGLRSGNLSFAVVGASLVALAVWRRHPLSAGLLLALSTVTKPIAPVGLAALAAHRPSSGGRKHLLAAGTGVAIAAALTLASPFLLDYLQLDGNPDAWPLRRSTSLYRWLHLMGLDLPPIVLVLLVALATAWLSRRVPISPRRLYILAIAGMTLATPALWSHTLLLTLPVQIMALVKVGARLGSRDSARASTRHYEFAFVILAVAALTFVDGIGGGLEVAPVALQVLALAVPVWAPVGLGIYVWRTDGPPT